MPLKKTNFPEVGEIVICTVKKILYHSVFVNLDEFTNREGLVHISEVSPGRIRNLRDYVREGKVIVCKVLRINEQKNHIDLSLRRVNLSQRKNKLEEVAQENKSEKLIEVFAKQTKRDPVKLLEEINTKIKKDYDFLFEAFRDVSENGENILLELGMEKDLTKELTKHIQDRIKKVSVNISGTYSIRVGTSDGVKVIKKVLKNAKKLVPQAEFSYTGAPNYKVIIEDSDYKSAEEKLAKITDSVKKEIEKAKGSFDFKKNG
jgi:translation initiation factor 2 subunit 1